MIPYGTLATGADKLSFFEYRSQIRDLLIVFRVIGNCGHDYPCFCIG
jgi:hypothetical protein